jgi:hypothetical protein
LTGFLCGRPLLMVNFYLGLVGIHPGNDSTHSTFRLFLTGFYLLLIGAYLSLKGIHLCKHFFSVNSSFCQQACHHLFRLLSLAV